MKYPREWEDISIGCLRLKVHGGWVVHTFNMQYGSSTFVPDPNHEWELE